MSQRPSVSFREALICLALTSCYPALAHAAPDSLAASHAEASLPVARVGEWSIATNDARLAAAMGDLSALADKSGVEIAAETQRRAALAGVMSISASVDEPARAIFIRAENVSIAQDGSYARFFRALDGRPLSKDEFDAKARLAQTAARYNNDRLDIQISNPQNGAMPLSVRGVATADRRVGGALTFSTYGQRYSGRDLATASANANIGHDTQIAATLSKGLPGLRDDSRGGAYVSATAEINHATEQGVATLRANRTVYKSGGPLLPYDLNGSSTRVDLELNRPLSATSELLFGVGVASAVTDIRAAQLRGEQRFAYGMAGYRGQRGALSYGARFYQGLGGSESFNVAPLSGEFNPRFSAAQIDARGGFDLGSGWSVDIAGAAQAGSRGVPGAMQFYGGGLERGRAFNTGNIAGPSGLAGSATLSKAMTAGVSGYAGVDYARASQTAGGALAQGSVFVGARGALGSSGVNFDIALAKPVKTVGGESKKPVLMMMFSKPF